MVDVSSVSMVRARLDVAMAPGVSSSSSSSTFFEKVGDRTKQKWVSRSIAEVLGG